MNKNELLEKLEGYLVRVDNDVRSQLSEDYNMGFARWKSWRISVQRLLESYLPFYLNDLKKIFNSPLGSTLYLGQIGALESAQIAPSVAFLKSLIIDIQLDDYLNLEPIKNEDKKSKKSLERKGFIVHGHDDVTKLRTARFLEKLGFEAIILHEQANGGKTIIEKLEHFTDVGFGIVLYAPDDVGETFAKKEQLQPRARQNVVFEHGLLIGKLGRNRVFPLVIDHSVELPSDINGMVYMSDRNWEFDLAKEIKALGFQIDLNALLS